MIKYSEHFKKNRKGTSIFIKRYNDKYSHLIQHEFLKSKMLYEISKDSPYFNFPRPLKCNKEEISFEFIKNNIDFKYFLLKNNNIFFFNKKKVYKIINELGKALGQIHNKLQIKNKVILEDNIKKGKQVFLFGDLGLSNILINNNKITLIDSSFNHINKKVNIYGSFYYDLAYFFFNLQYLYPLFYRILINFKKNNKIFTLFLKSYESETKRKINLEILTEYFFEIKKQYIRNIDTSILTGKIWNYILKNDKNFKKI